MNLGFMETAAKNSKPIWDSIVLAASTFGVLLQSAMSLEIVTWVKIFMLAGIGTFAFVRAVFWIRNNGYEDGSQNE